MTKKNISELKNNQCCGCGACAIACPVKCIEMVYGEDGALYPQIDSDKCVSCGKCLRYCCIYDKMRGSLSSEVYGACIKDDKTLQNSASGGIFSALAKKVIATNGVVYGAAYVVGERGISAVQHIRVESIADLKRLQGSKYVQSEIYSIYDQLREDLRNNKEVLFSGTPCQVSAIKKIFPNSNNLTTVDIICHGVPGTNIFLDYLKYWNTKRNAIIEDFQFRNKSRGWGFNANIVYRDKDKKSIIVPGDLDPYYYFFLRWSMSRDVCYQCAYADNKRISDITIGDYNGVQDTSPEFLRQNGGPFQEQKGISCLLVNSQKGKRMLESILDSIDIKRTTFEKVSMYNRQLLEPCEVGVHHDEFFEYYKKYGWKKLVKLHKRLMGRSYYTRRIKELIYHKNLL